LTKELTQVLQQSTIGVVADGRRLPDAFTYSGKPTTSTGGAFGTACQQAEISGVVCREVRHTPAANMQQAKVGYVRSMASAGHWTVAVFRPYRTIDRDDHHMLSTSQILIWTPLPRRPPEPPVAH